MEQRNPLEDEGTGEARSDAREKCPQCFGVDGHHLMNCPNIGAESTAPDEPDEEAGPTDDIPEEYDEIGGAVMDEETPESDERNPAEGRDEIPPAQSKSQEKRFAAQGAGVAGTEDPKSFADKIGISPERQEGIGAAANVMASEIEEDRLTPEEEGRVGAALAIGAEQDAQKIPPSSAALAGNDMLWLIAKLCHEANRAFCAMITGDHSQVAWEDASEGQRESCYAGVVGVYENPKMTSEESHEAWCVYKMSRGWEFGNMKSEEHRTHPNLVPYHQLHVHERFKDRLFLTICKTMLGGEV